MLEFASWPITYLMMINFATPLLLLTPESHRPGRLIVSDFKEIIFNLSIEWSN